VRALAARYRSSVSGRKFENEIEIYTAMLVCRPLQMELQALSEAIKPLITKEKYRKPVFFVI
jgi:hypothetical protein